MSNTHWGVTRGSDATLGQGLEHLTCFVISLDPCQAIFYTLTSSSSYPPWLCPSSPLSPTTESRITSCSSAFFAFRGLEPQVVSHTTETSGRLSPSCTARATWPKT